MGGTGPNAGADAGTTGYTGIVLAVQANFYSVQFTGAEADWPRLLCTRRARLKKLGQQVMVGDRVQVESPDRAGLRGAISDILPRQGLLDRPPVANVDQVLLLFSLTEPALDAHQLSRFLIKAESTGLRVCLGLNKQDLVSAEEQEHWRQRLEGWGYQPLLFSVATQQGISAVARELAGHTTVVSGPSGVGKSSLINHLIPQAQLRTSAVSGKLGRGRHTTRHVELFPLPAGGFLADTPGFNQPDLNLSPSALANCFPEVRQRLQGQQCQFSDCLHRDEPGCAVAQDWERYPLYRASLEEAMAHQQRQQHQPTAEAALKVKVGEAGQLIHEPRLQAKKYRRVSRRSRQQALQDFCDRLPDSIDDLDPLEQDDTLDFDAAD